MLIELEKWVIYCGAWWHVKYNIVGLTLRSPQNTIHQVTTILATSKNVLYPGHNHLLTTSTDDPTVRLSPER